jgi:two-component system chemotaxis response regulator CheY
MKRFLVVEDDELSRKVLEDCLSGFAECDTASNGKLGYDLFEKAIIEGRPYDLICSDILMPEVDGHELVRRIRSREASLPVVDYIRTKIFMISASGSPKDMTQAILDNSCDDYIVKPFKRETLKTMLQKYNLIDHANEP